MGASVASLTGLAKQRRAPCLRPSSPGEGGVLVMRHWDCNRAWLCMPCMGSQQTTAFSTLNRLDVFTRIAATMLVEVWRDV